MAIRPYGEGGVKELMYDPLIPCKVKKLSLAMPIKATFQYTIKGGVNPKNMVELYLPYLCHATPYDLAFGLKMLLFE